MDIQPKQSSYLKAPLYQLLIDLVLFAFGIIGTFALTETLLPVSGAWQPYLAVLPGLALSTLILVIYRYVRHYDELARQLAIKALAMSTIVGSIVLLVSITRASIAGYAELESGLVLMAIALTFVLTSLYLSWRYR
ncbi:MAG: hypothetical protein HOL98_12085 [Gammaproteobacteria bacterium]|jgi:hypothetical protein|nr:hypothetical protein [Gammaproteobacteria bacterium]MBT5204186.1 hypothetical protein [Gammaproteobacteria bacterium]MBT5600954.1 hypothetical protein [Gammaproteobacteria bacterium]MBT6246716.1 hypothetical protein [Gammaproteobacteria bacterium]MBT7330533.1 hypothetical protein [Oceanospirillaceae bacterium]